MSESGYDFTAWPKVFARLLEKRTSGRRLMSEHNSPKVGGPHGLMPSLMIPMRLKRFFV